MDIEYVPDKGAAAPIGATLMSADRIFHCTEHYCMCDNYTTV
jgi:hypothetical protein